MKRQDFAFEITRHFGARGGGSAAMDAGRSQIRPVDAELKERDTMVVATVYPDDRIVGQTWLAAQTMCHGVDVSSGLAECHPHIAVDERLTVRKAGGRRIEIVRNSHCRALRSIDLCRPAFVAR